MNEPAAPIETTMKLTDTKQQEQAAARWALHEALSRISDAFKDVPDEELEREIARAHAVARTQRRAEREQAAHPA